MPLRAFCAIAALVLAAFLPPGAPPLDGATAAFAASEEPLLTVAPEGAPAPLETFDRARLEALGMTTIRTRTPWTDGVTAFEGPLLRDVVAASGAVAGAIKVSALNDYSYIIPIADVRDYPVILALKMNGRYMSVRDKGPLWVIYPRDDYPELDTKETDHRMVWQVSRISWQ